MDTIDRNDAYTVASLDDLAKIYANPLPHIATKETDHITEVGRAFIAASPFLVIATSNGTSIDCSPKGDAPGFVQLLDDRTLLIPDRPGNNRIDGMKNLLVNPKVGIIFMVPGSNETYRVSGSATISTDPELLKRFEMRGKFVAHENPSSDTAAHRALTPFRRAHCDCMILFAPPAWDRRSR